MWWNPRDVLSYNKLFSFVVGQRGGGKTYGSKKLVINNFIRKGEQFIYLRRWKTEFQDLNLFFADVMHEYPEHTFEVKGKKLFIDGQLAGFAIALSTALQKKSTSFRQVSYIIYDEFVIDSKVI
ncbi:phage DNA encapsidation protein, partial [Bacillus altitudinis]|uniref:phage DNA encapsidation protein n=1 Tax=Bacillus altitudinis TaxID=293387 RepID=UPI003D25102A